MGGWGRMPQRCKLAADWGILRQRPAELLNDVQVLDFDSTCAEMFGELPGYLLKQGISVPIAHLMIATIALVHDLTLVTNNTNDFGSIPWLEAGRLVDALKEALLDRSETRISLNARSEP